MRAGAASAGKGEIGIRRVVAARQAACVTVNKLTPCDIPCGSDRFGTASRMRDGRARCARAYCRSPWARGGWPTSGRKKNRCGTYSRHSTYSSVIAADIIQRALPAKPFLGGAGRAAVSLAARVAASLVASYDGQPFGVPSGLASRLAWRPAWAISLADVPAL